MTVVTFTQIVKSLYFYTKSYKLCFGSDCSMEFVFSPHLLAPPVFPALSVGGVAHGEGSRVSQNTVER